MRAQRARLAVALMLALPLAGCDDAMSPDRDDIALTFTGLEPLANGFHYEGWAVTAQGPVSTGKFNIGTGGAIVGLNGATIPGGEFDSDIDLGAATAIVITIEPAGDLDAVPATTKILAGTLNGGNATLGVAAPEALGTSFPAASGKFILATPTDGMINQRDQRHLVFSRGWVAPGGGARSAGTSLRMALRCTSRCLAARRIPMGR